MIVLHSSNRLDRQAGYTLFELIVSIAIISIVFGLAIAAYNTFNKRERLRQTGLNFKANLRFAQTKSLSAEKPTSGCTTFSGMRVSFTVNSYSIVHLCTEGAVGTSIDTTLPTDITFSPTPTTFTFLPLSRSTSLQSGQTIVLTNGVASYTLVISGGGDISDLE
ncbi:prepilin-type N-terminal cleavage/methylation domain-containing protein [Candidatus Woesebacteria bacterium]|jgi:prepilin-type N-terminal cleavage/methylation domain-containing protein|nr:prepilin-type N-terminal cleavage/methylation domain-containing protein [Candidatus Woesebacteria bacterium]